MGCDAKIHSYAVKDCQIIADESQRSRLVLRLYLKHGSQRATIWVVAAERSDAGRFIVHADQELPAFLELESTIKTYRHNHACR